MLSDQYKLLIFIVGSFFISVTIIFNERMKSNYEIQSTKIRVDSLRQNLKNPPESNIVAEILKDNVKILCWIMTSKSNTDKAIAVNSTWAKRCNKFVFITPNNETNLPSVDFGIPEGRDYLWEKTKSAFKWIYENEINNYDWFLKADDDTYVIMENLRFMLLPFSPDDPLYLGCRFKVIIKDGYMSGGAGYILSKETVKRFIEEALPDPKKCNNKTEGYEDVDLGNCLQKIGIKLVDTRDSTSKHRILPFSPEKHLELNATDAMPPEFLSYMYYPYKQGGPDCCSEYMISFHYVNTRMMYLMENLLYYIRPIGFVDEFWKMQFQNNNTKSIIETLKELALNVSQPINETEINTT